MIAPRASGTPEVGSAPVGTALQAAKARVEDFVMGATDCPEDAQSEMREKLKRLLREVEVAARVEAVEQWTSGRPF